MSRVARGLFIAITLAALQAPLAAQQSTLSMVEFHLQAQPLPDAVTAWAHQAGLQLIWPVGEVVTGRTSPAINGKYSREEALRMLLQGTGLTFSFVNADTVAIRVDDKSTRSQAGGSLRIVQNEPLSADEVRRAGDGVSQDSDKKVEPEDARLEEITVTATKRVERLIDVPQSVSVLSADDLSRLGAAQFRDFANTVPGLSFSTQGAGNTQISLRGVTVGTDIGPTVGIYVDEVPYGSSSSLTLGYRLSLDLGLFDMDRIEVLRGPQGTLYGASSMGGLIKYVTRQPDASRFGVDVQTGVSSTQDGGVSYNGAATINAPIVNGKVALRASTFYSRDGGFIDNLTLGQKDVDRSDIHGGRLDLLVTPTEALSVRITGLLQDISRDGISLADYRPTGVPVDGPLDQRRSLAEPFTQRFRLVSATVNYDFGSATLTSISAYQTGRSDFVLDLSALFVPTPFGAPYSAWGSLSHQTTDRFTQEVRLVGKSGTPLEWVIGGFYSKEDTDLHQEYILRDLAGQPAPNAFYDYTSPTTLEEYAAFGDLTWHPTDRFDVTAGMRYAQDRGTFETVGTGSFGTPRPLSRSSENVSTYLANARYHFSDSAIAYLRYATGYRPGGPNFVVRNPNTGVLIGPDTFAADKLNSYEAGFKAQTADRRFGLDLAGYYIDWKNIQVVTHVGGLGYRTNAPGGAAVRGAELSLTARATRSFTATAALGYMDPRMKEADPSLGARKGERLPNVPRSTAALNADYIIAFDGLQPTVGATLRYVSDRTSEFGSGAYHLPEYTSVDLRAGFVIKPVHVQLYVRNLFDKAGQTGPSALGGLPYTSVSILQPRTIGISATTSF